MPRSRSPAPVRQFLPDDLSPSKATALLPKLMADWDRLASRVTIAEAATRKILRQLQRESLRAHRATLRADEAERAIWAAHTRPAQVMALLLRAERLLQSLPENPCPSCRLRAICRPNCRRRRLLEAIADMLMKDFIRGVCQGCGRGEGFEHDPKCPLRREIQLRLQF